MTRIAGRPEDKSNYLKKLNEKSFPFLIADILFYIYQHQDIKILDGPGDGKRDILSIDKFGVQSITQCKFHNDFKTSVGSRETDEIAIALLKFKCQNGYFATTGKLSPQAKREFIDNYKDYELKYLEGFDIVDLVLSSPTLSSIWVSDNSIELTSKKLAIPFIIRSLDNDWPINEIPKITSKNIETLSETVSVEYFMPYRAPSKTTFDEYGHYIKCNIIISNNPLYLHLLEETFNKLISKTAKEINQHINNIAIRFGTPYYYEKSENEKQNEIKLLISPKTIILCDNVIYEEQEFTIPLPSKELIFPKRFGTLESSWAGWLLREIDSILHINCIQPISLNQDIITKKLREETLEKIDDSLFYIVKKGQKKQVSSILEKEEIPNWECEYGFDGYIIGWLHPFLTDDSPFYHINFKNDKNKDNIDENFTTFKNNIHNKLEHLEITPCNSKKAINYSVDSKKPLFIDVEYKSYDSAFLFHYFNDIPSPILMDDRKFTFTTIWKLPEFNTNQEIIYSLIEKSLLNETAYSFNLNNTKENGNYYAKLEIYFIPNKSQSASHFITDIYPKLKQIILKVETQIKLIFTDSKRATEEYWFYEIGIIFPK
ncbi:restriction endonuclease [Chryseobacterium bernardetii]|uniref:restriction endonuclease n=1 Tax=Chryseobacterium bernardetii TaxID=1241978 RepID=UPI003AF42D75